MPRRRTTGRASRTTLLPRSVRSRSVAAIVRRDIEELVQDLDEKVQREEIMWKTADQYLGDRDQDVQGCLPLQASPASRPRRQPVRRRRGALTAARTGRRSSFTPASSPARELRARGPL